MILGALIAGKKYSLVKYLSVLLIVFGIVLFMLFKKVSVDVFITLFMNLKQPHFNLNLSPFRVEITHLKQTLALESYYWLDFYLV